MKRLYLMIVMIVLVSMSLAGCGVTNIATNIGGNIGASYQEAAVKGTISAEQSITAWPYVSGLIKGLMADEYEYMMSKMSTNIIDELDLLADKETLTTEDKGKVIGYFVRLELIALKDNWDNYGVSIFNLVVKGVGL
jgi:hypothetical protein